MPHVFACISRGGKGNKASNRLPSIRTKGEIWLSNKFLPHSQWLDLGIFTYASKG